MGRGYLQNGQIVSLRQNDEASARQNDEASAITKVVMRTLFLVLVGLASIPVFMVAIALFIAIMTADGKCIDCAIAGVVLTLAYLGIPAITVSSIFGGLAYAIWRRQL